MSTHTTMTRPVPSASIQSIRLLAVALGGFVLAGCSSPSSSTPPPPAASTPVVTSSAGLSPELCSAAAGYQKAANALVNLDATKVGTDGVKAALQNLQIAADNLAAAAKDQFSPQVAELERAIASLKGTVAGLSSQDSPSANLGKITAAVSAVEQAAKPIVDSVRAGCPAVPPVELPPAS